MARSWSVTSRRPSIEDADLVIVVTDHDGFDYDEVARRSRLVLDTRNRLRRAEHVVTL